MTDISVEQLRELLNYDPETGKLTWRPRPVSLFKGSKLSPEWDAAKWNARHAGAEALTSPDNKGYLTGGILGRPARAHRVAWAIHWGGWPSEQIDHVNGNVSDNRIQNLRSVSNAENQRNQCTPKNNSSGAVGVTYNQRYDNWRAFITAKGKKLHLGCFRDFNDALKARREAEALYGYHQNHGRR